MGLMFVSTASCSYRQMAKIRRRGLDGVSIRKLRRAGSETVKIG